MRSLLLHFSLESVSNKVRILKVAHQILAIEERVCIYLSASLLSCFFSVPRVFFFEFIKVACIDFIFDLIHSKIINQLALPRNCWLPQEYMELSSLWFFSSQRQRKMDGFLSLQRHWLQVAHLEIIISILSQLCYLLASEIIFLRRSTAAGLKFASGGITKVFLQCKIFWHVIEGSSEKKGG